MVSAEDAVNPIIENPLLKQASVKGLIFSNAFLLVLIRL
ncbi:MAG: hypothetical protein KatS3mg035_0692 [Bacteroidia bacterium]|nr:MAG: hypothetical protein KatS3mg035_0692 [Bacteroidia bacterium]